MLPLLRWTLACLLALALPVQGVSAATMLACGGGMLHVHQEAQAHPAPHHHGGTASKPVSQASHKCSACASCCVGAAMPSAAVAIGSMPIRRDVPPFLAPSPTAFVGDGLERPPKPVPA